MASKLTKPLWVVLTCIVVGFTSFVVLRNLAHIWKSSRQLAALEREGEGYRKEIEADSTLIEQLRYDDYLEEYARERFHMQRRGEKVFILK